MTLSNLSTTAMALLLGFGTSVVLAKVLIPLLQRLKFGQFVRDDGPESHLKKAGTPTMGGVIFLGALIIVAAMFAGEYNDILPVLFVTLGFGLVGFLDDFIKIGMKRSMGLRAWQKMLGQFLVAACFIYYMIYVNNGANEILIPFIGEYVSMPNWLYACLLFFVLLGTVNGSNFTDGLDGLASSVTVAITVFFLFASFLLSEAVVVYPICGAFIGVLLGFLAFNVYPAKVFMGDTGSLALGGFVASCACVLKLPIFIVIVAFVYLFEVLSVIIQVASFKLTGKRVFKMAPIHHHFELCGWPETKVVAMFTIVTAILVAVGFMALS